MKSTFPRHRLYVSLALAGAALALLTAAKAPLATNAANSATTATSSTEVATPPDLDVSVAGLQHPHNSSTRGLLSAAVARKHGVAVTSHHGSAQAAEGGVAVGGKSAFAQSGDNGVAVVYEGPIFTSDVAGAPRITTATYAHSLAYSGNGGVALVKGSQGTARAGNDGAAVCQQGGRAVAFERGIAAVGTGNASGDARAGTQGIASNRGKGFVETGPGGVAIAWNGAQAKAGPGGVLIFGYTNAQGAPELQVVKIGEKGTLPDTPYILGPDRAIKRVN